MNNFFKNRVYAISGSTSGIGKEIAYELARNGARILALGRDENKLKNLINNLDGNKHCYRLFNSNELSTCEEAIKSAVEETGKLSGFIHSAGINYNSLLRDLDFNKSNELLQINLLCFFAFAKAICKMGRYEKEHTSIIGISSACVYSTPPALSVYAASKAGLNAAIFSLAKEYVNKKIRFNAIAPNYVKTDMTLKFANEFLGENEYLEKLKYATPLGAIEPNEVAQTALFLLSNKSSKITGECLKISGGGLAE